MPTFFELLPELAEIALIGVASAAVLGVIHGWREANECYFYMKRDGKYTGRAWGARHHIFDLNFLTVWTPLLFLAAALGHALPLAVVFGPYAAHLAYQWAGSCAFETRDWLHLRQDRQEPAAP